MKKAIMTKKDYLYKELSGEETSEERKKDILEELKKLNEKNKETKKETN